MKKLYIAANWKSKMTIQEATSWLHAVASENGNLGADTKVVIICPPHTLLQTMQYKIGTFNSHIKIGAQNISPFAEGAYTGEIAASMAKEFCTYTLVGHSERRTHFHEDDQMIAEKIERAHESGLIPILCVQDADTPIPGGVTIVAYEPVFAIGTGKPDTPENAMKVCAKIKQAHPNLEGVLYGGSVTPENVHSFTEKDSIDGVLVGSASLDPKKFVAIVQNA